MAIITIIKPKNMKLGKISTPLTLQYRNTINYYKKEGYKNFRLKVEEMEKIFRFLLLFEKGDNAKVVPLDIIKDNTQEFKKTKDKLIKNINNIILDIFPNGRKNPNSAT